MPEPPPLTGGADSIRVAETSAIIRQAETQTEATAAGNKDCLDLNLFLPPPNWSALITMIFSDWWEEGARPHARDSSTDRFSLPYPYNS